MLKKAKHNGHNSKGNSVVLGEKCLNDSDFFTNINEKINDIALDKSKIRLFTIRKQKC